MRFTLLALALALGGCATQNLTPKDYLPDAPSTAESAAEQTRMSDAWNQVPLVTEGKASVVLFTPEALPPSLRDKKISLELEPGATVQDLVAILGRLGVPIIVADVDAAKKTFYLPRYDGALGGLLSAVTRATDVWFTWHDGAVQVSPTERFSVSVPQEAAFGETLTKGLEALGLKDGKSVTWQAGMAVMEITPSQFRKVKVFLERYTANAAIISLQLAVVNVSLNQSAKQGIDWQALQLAGTEGGSLADMRAWQTNTANATSALARATTPIPTAPATTAGGTTVETVATAAAAAVVSTNPAAVAALGLANGALTGALFSSRFSFTSVFNFLQTYGNAETKQNVMLKTVAGTKVELKSVTSVPYIAEIGNVTTTTNAASTNAGSTKTARADDGITVEMTPYYDAASNSVTVDFKLSVKAVVAFTEMSAGATLGKITQPTTAERSFTDSLRLQPGQTVVIGGLTYDSYSSNKGAPVFLSGTSLESESLTVNKQSMFIVVRPTVVKLGQVLRQEAGESLDLLPVGAYTPEPAAPAKAKRTPSNTKVKPSQE